MTRPKTPKSLLNLSGSDESTSGDRIPPLSTIL